MSDDEKDAQELQRMAMEELMKSEELRVAADKLKNIDLGEDVKLS